MDPVDVEYKIIDVIDMAGTIVIRARDVNTNVEVSMNVNSNSFHEMTETAVDHMIVDMLCREINIQEKKKVAMATGTPNNLMRLRTLMGSKATTKLHPIVQNAKKEGDT